MPMSSKHTNLYIAWVPFQRRAQSLATSFDLKACYYHFDWGERGKMFRLMSWFAKGAATLKDLIKHKPDFIIIQLAPTPLLYVAAFYGMFSRCRYVSDCHNTMLYDAHNIHWPLAKFLLRRSAVVVVHNDDVKAHADRHNISSQILRDPLPTLNVPDGIKEVAGISLKEDYALVPGSMAEDEPLEELFDAARALPDTLVVLTWFFERLPEELRSKAPGNIRFTGFLDEPDFNALYANANVAIVLTTREGTQPSGASEAISLGIPLVVSDISTTRRLYQDNPIYVDNSAKSITDGISEALSDYDKWSARVSTLRAELTKEAEQQIAAVKSSLA